MDTESALDPPQDRYYSREHNIWAQRDDAGQVRVGVDSLLLSSLGELAYIALFDPGRAVTRGHSIGTLEAAKMTTAIAAPVSGVITATNEAVLADPQLINRAPYSEGWLVELDPTNWEAESSQLVFGDAIPEWAEESKQRLKAEFEPNE